MVLSINPVIIIFLVLLAETTIVSCFRNGDSHILCFETEKQALLSFKKDLVDSSNELQTWDVAEEEDCCKWARVVCNNITGHVSELWLNEGHLKGKLNPSLLNLTHLTHLDLSLNDFGEINIPNFMGSVVGLRYLNLSSGGFKGMIPHQLGNLSSLHHLSLSYNNISGPIPNSIGKLSALKSLDISSNQLNGSLPESIGSLSNLESLILFKNKLNGPLPESLGFLSNLEYLTLYENKLNGPLPESLGFLSNLEVLDIHSNHLEGHVSEVHFANLTNLREIIANGNQLSLRVSPHWIPPFHLNRIELGSWILGPQFPMWLKSQKEVSSLDLSNTSISDAIPNWFWNLSTGGLIDLSHNQIDGEIPFLPAYREIYLNSNNFTGPIPRISSGIWILDISNNFLSGDISRFFCEPMGDDNNLFGLYLKDNLLSGEIPIPKYCWKYWPILGFIHLDNNKLTGEIPSSMGHLQRLLSLHLRNNNLIGKIPDSLQNHSYLSSLDLSLNDFVGAIPRWIGNLSHLQFLGLRSNKLIGHIPVELCALDDLQILDIADNMLSGRIPSCLGDLTTMMTLPEDGPHDYPTNCITKCTTYRGVGPWGESNGPYRNYFHGIYGREIGWTFEDAILVIKGRERLIEKIFYLVTYLDLSCNNLSGEIPKELTNLQGLRSLNLSHNNLRGSIPDMVGNITWVESLDLSWNHLSGKIPSSISSLSFLNHLNFSYNNLSGKIPTGTQLQSFDAFSFVGNQLCGPPFSNDCGESEKTTHGGAEIEEGETKEEEEYWFRLGIAMGFAISFLGVIVPLLFSRIWRRAYFWFFQEYLWYKILDCFINFKYMLQN